MNEFYSIRRDDLIRLLADHYELNALINAGVDNWEWHDEAIQSDLAEWKKTLKKDDLTYEQIAEFIAHVLKDKEESFKKRYISMLSKLDEDGWEALEQVAEMMCKTKKD